jgi:hypothetical protein
MISREQWYLVLIQRMCLIFELKLKKLNLTKKDILNYNSIYFYEKCVKMQ